jgi:hypothetical protein
VAYVETLRVRTSPLLLAEAVDRLAPLRASDLSTIERARAEHVHAHDPARQARRLLRALGLTVEDRS